MGCRSFQHAICRSGQRRELTCLVPGCNIDASKISTGLLGAIASTVTTTRRHAMGYARQFTVTTTGTHWIWWQRLRPIVAAIWTTGSEQRSLGTTCPGPATSVGTAAFPAASLLITSANSRQRCNSILATGSGTRTRLWGSWYAARCGSHVWHQ